VPQIHELKKTGKGCRCKVEQTRVERNESKRGRAIDGPDVFPNRFCGGIFAGMGGRKRVEEV